MRSSIIQITNASLLDIEGGIGTGVDNGRDLDLVPDRRDRGNPAHRLSQPSILVPPLYAASAALSRPSRSPAPSPTISHP